MDTFILAGIVKTIWDGALSHIGESLMSRLIGLSTSRSPENIEMIATIIKDDTQIQQQVEQLEGKKKEELRDSSIDLLKKALVNSNLASSNKRRTLLSKIQVREDFDGGRNIDNYSDTDFTDRLVLFLSSTEQKTCLKSLCEEIETMIKTGDLHDNVRAIASLLK